MARSEHRNIAKQLSLMIWFAQKTVICWKKVVTSSQSVKDIVSQLDILTWSNIIAVAYNKCSRLIIIYLNYNDNTKSCELKQEFQAFKQSHNRLLHSHLHASSYNLAVKRHKINVDVGRIGRTYAVNETLTWPNDKL